MARPKTKLRSAEEIAAELGEVRSRMADDAIKNKALTAAFKLALETEKKTKAGGYHLVPVKSFTVVEEELALQFALLRGAAKIDTAKVKAIFSLDATLRFEDPEKFGFGINETTKVAPISSKDKEDDNG